MTQPDVLDEGLEQVADAAESAAADQRQAVQQARRIQGERARGWSWATILDRENPLGLLQLLRRSSRTLAQGAARFTRLLAEQLSAQGHSRREVARHLGVSHQRIGAILTKDVGEGEKGKA